MVPELPSQSGCEPAADERDLQHGVGRTAQNVACTTKDPSGSEPEVAFLQMEAGKSMSNGAPISDGPPMGSVTMPVSYKKFTSQEDLGRYLTNQYHIRRPEELSSCETCHR